MFNFKPVAFTVRVVGDRTGEEHAGEFKVKPMLSYGEQLEADRVRRQFLGDRPEAADKECAGRALALGELSVRVTSSPSWWKEFGAGAALYDDNVLLEVYAKAMEVEKEHVAEIAAKAEAAKKKLAEQKTA